MANHNHPVQWEQIAQHLDAKQPIAGSVSHPDALGDAKTLNQAAFIWEKSAKLCPVSAGKARAISAIMGKCQSATATSSEKSIVGKKINFFPSVLRYAASVAVLLMAGWATYYFWPTSVQQAFEAPDNSNMLALLPDGTHVWLKAGSSLSLSEGFGQNQRHVILDGDAFFDVAHNPAQPFVISQEEYDITVLGTSFDIKYVNGFAQVTVRTGKVKMENTDTQESVELLPGEVGTDEGSVLAVDVTSLAEVANWIQESPIPLSFDKTTLSDVASILNTTFNIQVDIAPSLSSRKLTASFSGGRSIESILETITKATGTSLRKEGDKYVIEE